MDQESRKNRRPPEFSSGGPAVFYVCAPFDAAAGTVAYRAAAYRRVRRFTVGCGGSLPGAAVYRRGRLLPLDAAAYRRVRQLMAGCGGLPLGAAAYGWVRRFTVGCSDLPPGAAVCRRGGGLPPGTVAAVGCGSLPLGTVVYHRVQPLTAGCGGSLPGAAVYRWVQQLTSFRRPDAWRG